MKLLNDSRSTIFRFADDSSILCGVIAVIISPPWKTALVQSFLSTRALHVIHPERHGACGLTELVTGDGTHGIPIAKHTVIKSFFWYYTVN